ncbi:glutaredoxin family protein [Actinophytocola sp.]|uniref:glutaredoxin family protein n=1 Tax=Actinophytocola sp. TaxID=1872138 RepID=UPI0025C3A9F7|nr:glutaredoxin family protein [Actinophytocola sp.]
MFVTAEGDGRTAVEALTSEQAECVWLFGADWCADCRRAVEWLTRHDVPFTMIDTNDDDERSRAARIVGGRTNIPVLVVPDGRVLVEPTNVELAGALTSYRRRRGAAWVRCR